MFSRINIFLVLVLALTGLQATRVVASMESGMARILEDTINAPQKIAKTAADEQFTNDVIQKLKKLVASRNEEADSFPKEKLLQEARKNSLARVHPETSQSNLERPKYQVPHTSPLTSPDRAWGGEAYSFE